MKKFNVKQFIRTDIAQIKPYAPGTSAEDLAEAYKQNINQLIKLNANENLYGSSPIVKKVTENTFFNYYPRSDYPILRQKLAKYTKVKKENIIIGSGSDEIIDILLRATLQENDKVVLCAPTFGMYEFSTRLNRGIIVNVPRNKNFEINLPGIIKSCNSKKVKIVILCNPNNPTGNLIPQLEIERILQTGKLVVIDEAYYEFSKQTAIPLLSKYENLVIVRTLSKWAALAGLRIGYGISSNELVAQLMKIKPPFNVNIAAEKTAILTLQDLTFAKKFIKKIIEERNRLYKELRYMPGILVYQSYGNFIYIKADEKIYKLLRSNFEKNKIALRYYPNLKYGIRITIGKPKQNNKVLKVIKETINQKKYAFLDRDGTLIFEPQDTFQIDTIKKLKILDGAIKGLKELKRQNYQFVIVTNQNGLGTPSFPYSKFRKPQEKMIKIFNKKNIEFEKIFICPHLPSANCDCRKPKIGLVKTFFDKNNIDKDNSFVLGDRNSDKQFAKNLKLKYISIKTNGNFYDAITKKGVSL